MKLSRQIAKAKTLVESEPTSPEGEQAKEAIPQLEDRLNSEFPLKDVASGQIKNLECWFMGCHSDVGGGNDQNDYPSLSNIPFRCASFVPSLPISLLFDSERCGWHSGSDM
jgi:hypothetical protein